jgi:hypothetical protein
MLPALYATHNFIMSQLDTIRTVAVIFTRPPIYTQNISSQSQQKVAARSSLFCLFTLVFILLLLALLFHSFLFTTVALFLSFSVFVSFILPNSIPWLIYFS